MIQRASDGSATGEALDPKANATARQRYADLGRARAKKAAALEGMWRLEE